MTINTTAQTANGRLIEYIHNTLKVATLAKVKSVHTVINRVTVDCVSVLPIRVNNGWENVEFDSVPISCNGMGNGGVEVPIKSGDIVAIVFTDYNSKVWQEIDKQLKPYTGETHTFNNAIAIPFSFNPANTNDPYSASQTKLFFKATKLVLEETSAVLTSANATMEIAEETKINSNNIDVNAKTKATITAPETTITGNTKATLTGSEVDITGQAKIVAKAPEVEITGDSKVDVGTAVSKLTIQGSKVSLGNAGANVVEILGEVITDLMGFLTVPIPPMAGAPSGAPPSPAFIAQMTALKAKLATIS